MQGILAGANAVGDKPIGYQSRVFVHAEAAGVGGAIRDGESR
jgi:hypothetical protein